MNLRKHARVQQAPMPSFVPSSVSAAFAQGRHHKPLPSSHSQPIPIAKRRPSPQERELEDLQSSADSASQYDWATWQMYTRITNARRLRAVSRTHGSAEPPQPVVFMHDFHHMHLAQQLHQGQDPDRPSSTVHDLQDDEGVFVFDAM